MCCVLSNSNSLLARPCYPGFMESAAKFLELAIIEAATVILLVAAFVIGGAVLLVRWVRRKPKKPTDYHTW